MSAIVWVHEDWLGEGSPALRAAPGAPAVFVLDDAVLAYRGYGLKRLGFIYECLLALPVTILRGATVATVLEFARAHEAGTIHAVVSVCPQLRRFARELRAEAELIPHQPPPFVTPPAGTDLKRFSRYWRAVAGQAMRPTRMIDG